MTITWPPELPQAPLFNCKPQPLESKVMNQPGAGPPMSRPRFHAVGRWESLTMQFRLTAEQKTILEEFYEDDTTNGSEPFEFPYPDTGDTVNVLFRSKPAVIEPELPRERWIMEVVVEVIP
jgi:hypothetical protein